MRKEAAYQRELIGKLKTLFPGCHIVKNDAGALQGIPDLLILWGDRWAMLELKRSYKEKLQPNQEYHVEQFGQMSFAAFIYPENEEQVLYDLQSALGASR